MSPSFAPRERTVSIQDLERPFTSEVIKQVRLGKIKPLYNLALTSAIYKTVQKGPVRATLEGLVGDEHAYEFHGGPDKAILLYCDRHYTSWKEEHPESEHRFTIGGFGENFVVSIANERNLCIGDILQVGDQVRIQVCLPRQPCFKLNHRFEVKTMSAESQEKSRTGIYCRVLTDGFVQEGDCMTLESRVNPHWTVARVQHYLHRDRANTEAMKELIQLEGLGEECKTIFRNRLKQGPEDQDERLVGDETMALQAWTEYRLIDKVRESSRVYSFTFEAVLPLPNASPILPGSHVRLKLGGNLMRAYSVVSGTSARFVIGVALASNSRGGSSFLHTQAHVGDVFSCSPIVASFPLREDVDHHTLIAGGIGITAFLAAAQELERRGQSYTLHLAVRDRDEVPFMESLQKLGAKVIIHDKNGGHTLDVQSVLGKALENTCFYCCGPERLMSEVRLRAKDLGIPESLILFETFTTDSSGDLFTVQCNQSRKTIAVPSQKSLLNVLRKEGFEIASSCEAGNCGTCRIPVLAGRVEHRGTGLLESEKCDTMLSCVSRGVGEIVIDL